MTLITLHESDDSRVVQLSGEYSTSWGCSINELKAVFFQTGYVELHRFKNDDGSEVTRFSLSEEEAAAFFEAHETFKAAQEVKKLLEQKRIADIVQQARAILADTPITLEEHPATETNTLYWTLRFDEPDISRHAQNTDALLKHTKDMKAIYERHQATQRIHDEVKALIAVCPAIKITGTLNQPPWYVSIDAPDIYGEWAQTPEQALVRVKAAKAKYEEWQAEQLIKTND